MRRDAPSGYHDLICALALCHSDWLLQVKVTLVKGDNPTIKALYSTQGYGQTKFKKKLGILKYVMTLLTLINATFYYAKASLLLFPEY